jgi:hypothetical protein
MYVYSTSVCAVIDLSVDIAIRVCLSALTVNRLFAKPIATAYPRFEPTSRFSGDGPMIANEDGSCVLLLGNSCDDMGICRYGGFGGVGIRVSECCDELWVNPTQC